MTFKDIAIKNFKLNMKRYKTYFLCNSFTIFIFFIYSTLFFNPSFKEGLKVRSIQGLLFTSLTAIAIFSFFFINYANTSFIRSRNKEFGLFLTLGMTQSDITTMNRIENIMIAVASLATGLLCGTIFSRLFFLIIIKTMGLVGIEFSLTINSYLLTMIVFLAVFFFMSIRSGVIMRKMEIIDLLKEKRRIRTNKSRPLLGVIGIILLVTSVALIVIIEEYLSQVNAGILFVISVISCFLGTYFVITQFGNMLLLWVKKDDRRYFSHILTITEINKKFKQHSKIVYVATVLAVLIVVFNGITIFGYFQIPEIGEMNAPNDIMFIDDVDNEGEIGKRINDTILQSRSEIKEYKSFEFIPIVTRTIEDGVEFNMELPAISEEEYVKNYSTKVNLDEGEVMLISQNESSIFEDQKIQFKLLSNGDTEYSFSIKERQVDARIPISKNSYIHQHMLVVSNEAFNRIKGTANSTIDTTLHIVNFNNTSDGEHFFNEISRYLDKGIVKVTSKTEVEAAIKQVTSFQLFISGFIGFLFFIASGAVLYFNLYNDIEDSRERYKQLYKIGITTKEITSSIAKEIRLIFYIPVAVGSTLGFISMMVLTRSSDLYRQVLLDTLIVISAYLIFQTIFYLITKKRHIDEII